MLNQPLIALSNSVLGTGKQTARGNFAYHCPYCNHHKPKLEINFTENKKGENPWHCWVCDKRGKKLLQIFKQGIAQNMTVFVPTGDSQPTYTKGNYYYLGMDNTALANSNLLYPTKFNDSNVSNFKILAPDGEWKNIFSKEQGVEAEAEFTCNGRPNNFVYYLTAPTPYTDEHSGIPLATEFDYMIDTYAVNESWSDLKSSASINDIMVVLNNQIPYYAGGVMGVIPNTFYSWSQSLRSGYRDWETDRKSTRLNSSHSAKSRMPSSA